MKLRRTATTSASGGYKRRYDMAKRSNSTEVLANLVEYATRYGYDALGYALLNMAKEDVLHITDEQVNEMWEYGGNNPEWASKECVCHK